MNRTTTTVVALVAVLFSLLTACSKRDGVYYLEGDDPEMAAAIAKARATLPQFWQAFDKREGGESDFSLKVKFAGENGAEHFWVTEIERRDGKTIGTIYNDSQMVKSVKRGDRIEISETDITDWLYMRDGKVVGYQTLEPLLKRMPAAEAEERRKMLAIP